MRPQRFLPLLAAATLVALVSASCSMTADKYIPRASTWTPTPNFNYSHLTAQSWTRFIPTPGAPPSGPDDQLKISARVQTNNGIPISQATITASGPVPSNGGPSISATMVVVVGTPWAGTNPSSGSGTYYNLIDMTASYPGRGNGDKDQWLVTVAPVSGNTVAYIPPQSIFNQQTPTPVAIVQGVLDYPHVTNVTGYQGSGPAAPIVVPPSGGQITITWSCVQNAAFYLVDPIQVNAAGTTISDLGTSAPIQGDTNCGTSTYSYSFPASVGNTYAVTITATDMQLDMFTTGRNPFDVADISTTTLFVTP